MYFVQSSVEKYASQPTDLLCPSCGLRGAFLGFAKVPDLQWSHGEKSASGLGLVQYFAGLRHCPNIACRAVVAAFSNDETGRKPHPPETVKFDTVNLPPSIVSSLEEAVKCHAAACYQASALMLRRALEQLCNHRSDAGASLKGRITALNGFASISDDGPGARAQLRVIVNDTETLSDVDVFVVSREESDLAIELALQVLKGVYQYASLRTRLLSLKIAPMS
jgi:hypothetical protein